jgi:hypothetical protein
VLHEPDPIRAEEGSSALPVGEFSGLQERHIHDGVFPGLLKTTFCCDLPILDSHDETRNKHA